MSPHFDLTHPPRGAGAPIEANEFFAVTRFFDAARLIGEALSKQLEEHHDMTIRDYELLVRLDGAGNEMRLAELADVCVFSNPQLTQTLVRLEDRGWIHRRKAVGDGLGAVARLLPAGAEALAAAAPDLSDIIRDRLLSCWSADEIDAVGSAMEASATRMRELRL